MYSILCELLSAVDGVYPPVVGVEWVETWPTGELDRYLATGLLRPARLANDVTCRECGETAPVTCIATTTMKRVDNKPAVKGSDAHIVCPNCGWLRIPIERVRQWKLSYEQLLHVAFAGTKISGPRREIHRDRVWCLGKAAWCGASRNVYFARGLHRRGAWRLLAEAKITPRSVLFVPAMLPEDDPRIDAELLVIPLTTVLHWEGDEIGFDQQYIEAELAASLAKRQEQADDKPSPAARGSRLALIEALAHELQEHLRSARDHALATLERAGTPQLLPRPRKDLLARKLGVHKSSVTRAFDDAQARELRFLWNLADDLDRILEHAGPPA